MHNIDSFAKYLQQQFNKLGIRIFCFLFIINFKGLFAQCTNPIQTFPFVADFEAGNGGWITGGNFSDWTWGTPTKAKISSAASGNNCWITGGLNTSFYNLNQRSYLQSPCFDFTGIALPLISFNIYWETENQYDGCNLQYSLDLGNTWQNVGTANGLNNCTNSNWYNNASINNLNGLATVRNGWCGNTLPTTGNCQGGGGSNGWVNAKQTVPALANANQVIFRFTFGAGSACNNFDGVAIDDFSINNASNALQLSTATSPETCKGNDGAVTTTVLGGLSPISYLWDNGSTLSGLINIPNGTYTVTVTDAINCSVSATAVIVKVPAVLTSINITPDTCSHALGSIALNVWQGTAPYTYQWQPNVSNNAQAVNLTAGSYQILVTDINTCTQSIHTTVGDAGNINVSIGADTLICDTFNLQLMPGNYDTYLWQDGSSANTFHANTAGTYTVTVTEGTCTTSTSVQIFNDCNETLYIPNAFSPNEDGLNDRFIIETGLTTAYTLQIYNRYGALIFETQNSESGWNGLDGSKIVQSDLYGFVLQYTKFGRKSKLVTGTVRVIP
ncbi:MAG: gliding motility-associated C-terminal domain-containing protein [Bacteroidia bacterium]|nr:gliding motility-associated C-terminal domain-containing protein [Bacteroidia bacterium]